MAAEEFVAALKTGWEAVDPEADLLVVGEMGIGNTTAAAAISATQFLRRGGVAVTGRSGACSFMLNVW